MRQPPSTNRRRSAVTLVVISLSLILTGYNSAIHAQWKPLAGLYGGIVQSFAKVDDALYVGTQGAGVFMSLDHGRNWTDVNNTPGMAISSPVLTSITMHGTHDTTWLVAVSDSLVYRSSNGGRTWLRGATLPFGSFVEHLMTWDGRIWAYGYYGMLYSSSDAGLSWKLMSTSSATSMTANETAVFYGTARAGMYRSMDKGKTWTRLTNRLQSESIYDLITIDSVVFAIAGVGVFRSYDNGTTMQEIARDEHARRLASFGSTLYVLRTADSAFTQSVTLLASTDDGTTWMSTPVSVPYGQNAWIVFVDEEAVYIGVTGLGVLRRAHNSSDWTVSSEGITAHGATAFGGNSRALFLAAANSGLFSHTVTAGWQQLVATRLTSNIRVTPMQVFHASDSLLIISQRCDTIMISTDDGTTFAEHGLGLDVMCVSELLVADGDLYAGTKDRWQSEGAIYRSTNLGATWTAVGGTFPTFWVDALATRGRDIYMAASGHGVYVSSDRGTTWTSIGPKDIGISEMIATDTSLIVCTNKGLMRYSMLDKTWQVFGTKIQYPDSYTTMSLQGDILYLGSNVDGYRKGNGVVAFSLRDSTWYVTGLTGADVRTLFTHQDTLYAALDPAGIWCYAHPTTSVDSDEPLVIGPLLCAPNPARDEVLITLPMTAVTQSPPVRIRIVPLHGEGYVEYHCEGPELRVPLDAYASGLYAVECFMGAGISRSLLLIIR